MSSRMQGMDTDQARQVSGNMDSHAAQVAGIVQHVGNVVGALNWQGADRHAFESDWQGSFAPNANAASQSLSEQAHVLRTHADRQDAASS